MKKSTFVAMILGTVGGILFALGMCMTLIPEWNAFRPGVIMGAVGAAVLLMMVLVWRKMENKEPIKLSGKTIGATLIGIVLLFMNQALAAIVAIVVKQNKGFEYAGSLIYTMALYAFYAVITSVMNVVKFRKYGSPVMSAAKVINLTAALVSMLSLETAMLAQFGEDDVMFRQIMTSATGAGVCIIVLGMAVFMIVKSTKVLKNINQDEIAGGAL